jgi:glycosyltransferase involved in cell wall biosynthesis
VILGFHTKQLTERGTEVALFDYAIGAQELLGHEARIFVPADTPKLIPEIKKRFEQHFDVVLYASPRDIQCDALYVIKRGFPGRITERTPELVHAFHDASHPHGHRFATVSQWVSHTAAWTFRIPRGRVVTIPKPKKPPVVPHIVTLPDLDDDLRSALSIPEDAVVFGRHGGEGTFNLDFVREAICTAVEQRDDVWFLLANVDRFCESSRVVQVPLMTDRAEIRRFINTCDYMIHAHALGETFGLAVAEFAYVGVPVMTFIGSPRLAQLDLLTDDLLLAYMDYGGVLTDFTTFPRRRAGDGADVRERYSPEHVMAQFDKVFLR